MHQFVAKKQKKLKIRRENETVTGIKKIDFGKIHHFTQKNQVIKVYIKN